MNKVEILAPVGSFEALEAALKGGCDAVYTGGSRFGARASAHNFDEETMCQVIDLVHLHGKKIYMTVNTLLYEDEIDTLYDYMVPYVQHGLDAVIVQDVGVMTYLHQAFEDLPIHASTQMTLCTGKSAEMLKPYGVTRFVPARELSIQQLEACRQETDLEMEVFVHGALCYSFSGQCLLSSFIGGRSGNRGRCAQPCRLPYKCQGVTGYLLSPKDVCTVDRVEELMNVGIDSFKIEGRMKSHNYTAYTSMAYKKAVEDVENGYKQSYDKIKDNLADIYNRGGFCGGFLFDKSNKEEIIYPLRNSHYGLCIGEVLSANDRRARIKLIRDVNGQDVVEFRETTGEAAYEFTIKESQPKDTILTTNIMRGSHVYKGQKVYRTKNTSLLTKLENLPKAKIALKGHFTANIGETVKLTIEGKGTKIIYEGPMAMEAKNRPVTEEDILKRLNRTGETEYVFETLTAQVDDGVFIALGAINDVRREAIRQWEKTYLTKYSKKIGDIPTPKHIEPFFEKGSILVNVANEMQAKAVMEREGIILGLKKELFSQDQYDYLKKEAESKGLKVYNMVSSFEGLRMAKDNLESFIMNHNMYTTNTYSIAFHHAMGASAFLAPLDATKEQKQWTQEEGGFVTVYGYQKAMVSQSCVKRTLGKCDHQRELLTLENEREDKFIVENHCENCYNIIYIHEPVVDMTIYDRMCIDFTIETDDEVRKVLTQWRI